jgi:hypothetical protein
MHPGEDLAQRSVFVNASRVTDWAHVIGACNRPKAASVHADERVKIFRSGAFATVQNKLSRAGQKLVPLVKRAFFCLRSVPTAMLFHSIATLLLRVLVSQQPPEEKAAKALQRHYLVKHDRRPLRSRIGQVTQTRSTLQIGGVACNGCSRAPPPAHKPKNPGTAGS